MNFYIFFRQRIFREKKQLSKKRRDTFFAYWIYLSSPVSKAAFTFAVSSAETHVKATVVELALAPWAARQQLG